LMAVCTLLTFALKVRQFTITFAEGSICSSHEYAICFKNRIIAPLKLF
jgi:hypothetical protein